MKSASGAALAAVFFVVVCGTGVSAQVSTGLDGLHEKVRVGGKLCMADHEHAGEGHMASKRAAELAAVRSWQEFTAWEYGSAWGSFGKATGKRISCNPDAGAWRCVTVARPCRSAR